MIDVIDDFAQAFEPGNAMGYAGILRASLSLSFVFLASTYVLSGIDDAFIDLVACSRRLRPKELSSEALERLAKLAQKHIAIIVPAWDEGDIIGRMILGNVSHIEYLNYHFFVGCYPNDEPTVRALKDVEARIPSVHSVINFKDGPTSKGQILNWVLDSIFDWEKRNGIVFDAFLMHDSEDVIHPKSLQLMNDQLNNADFIQIPVFSLHRNLWSMVAGTYVDEFAEYHTKDMLVRSYLGGCVPSAGVGTCMSRSLVKSRLRERDGFLFNDNCLTEDYEFGVGAGMLGTSQRFAAFYYRDVITGSRDYIATREYFPAALDRSIRQKTRWTLGIALQCLAFVGWRGSMMQRYFLYRDRKGIVVNPFMLLGYVWLVLFTLLKVFAPDVSLRSDPGISVALVFLTTGLAGNRLLQRMICVARVYGLGQVLAVPLRVPVGNVINAMASINAIWKTVRSRLGRSSIVWVKTSHELPQQFGLETAEYSATDASPVAVRGRS